VVSLAYVCLAIGSYLQLGMYLSGNTVMIGKLCAAAAVLTIGLNYLLISLFGMLGAAWATVVGFALLAAGSYHCSQRVYPMDLKLGRVLKGLLMAIALYGLSFGLRNSGVWVALAGKIMLLAGFPVALRLTGVFSGEEMATLGALRSSTLAAAGRWMRSAWPKKLPGVAG
jgi:O-antigen/teichoic acid export membrane protein